MRKYCSGEKIDLESFMDLHILNPLEYQKAVFGMQSV
jgi:hypothetical protein